QFGLAGPGGHERLERLQHAAHRRTRPTRPFGHGGDAAGVPGQQLDDEAGFLERVRTEHVNRLIVLFSDSGHNNRESGSCASAKPAHPRSAESIAQRLERTFVVGPAALYLEPDLEPDLASEHVFHVW